MSETPNLELAEQWGAHLAALPPEGRDTAVQFARQYVATHLPEEELPPENPPAPIRTLGEYLDTEIETPPAIIAPGLVVEGGVSVLISRGGKGKTALSLNRLLRWGAGLPLHDELPEVNVPFDGEPVKSLIIENEGSPGHFQRILRRILDGPCFTPAQRELARENVSIWGDGGWSGLKVDDKTDLELIMRGVEESGCKVLFLEPFRGLWTGEENSSTEMSQTLDKISSVANGYGVGVMITHHERKSKPGEGGDAMDVARGSGVFEGHCGVMERWKPVKNGSLRELSWLKARFEEAPAPIRMQFDRERWGYDYVPESEIKRGVLQFFQAFPGTYWKAPAVASEIDEDYNKVQKAMKELANETPPRLKSTAGDGAVQYIFHESGADDGEALAF